MTRGDVYMLDFGIPGSLPKDILQKIEAEIDYVIKE